MRATEFQPAAQTAPPPVVTRRVSRSSEAGTAATTRCSPMSMRSSPREDTTQTAPWPTARLVAAPAGIRSTTRRLAGSMRTTCSANGSASHTPPPPSAIVWLKPSSGPPSRGISATTRWRAGSTRSRTPRSPSPWEATQTAPRVALTEMASRSGPPREIRATTRLLAGSIRQTAPGTAIGTHTAPAPKANPEGPTAACPAPMPSGIVASTRLPTGSMRLTWSPPATHSDPAPNAMPYGKPPVPMVATTADRGAVVTGGAWVAEAAREGCRLGSDPPGPTRPAIATVASRPTATVATSVLRRRGRQRPPALPRERRSGPPRRSPPCSGSGGAPSPSVTTRSGGPSPSGGRTRSGRSPPGRTLRGRSSPAGLLPCRPPSFGGCWGGRVPPGRRPRPPGRPRSGRSPPSGGPGGPPMCVACTTGSAPQLVGTPHARHRQAVADGEDDRVQALVAGDPAGIVPQALGGRVSHLGVGDPAGPQDVVGQDDATRPDQAQGMLQ